MPNILESLSEKKRSGRILFTGSAERVIDDLMRRVPPEHLIEKCMPTEQNLSHTLGRFDPHVIVTCLADEQAEMMRMFSILEGTRQLTELPVIVIGSDDDCERFKKNVTRKNIRFFERPLNQKKFFETLEQYLNEQQQVILEEKNAAAASKAAAPKLAPPAANAQQSIEQTGKDTGTGKKKELSSLGGERATILVVDDDVRMLNMAKLCLQDLYDVVVVPSGKLALKYLSRKSADLVLLDYMMPEEDGPTVLRQIRQNSPQPDIPVLFLTGVDDKDMVLRGLEFHPRGYLLKPVTREVLIDKVTEILLGL